MLSDAQLAVSCGGFSELRIGIIGDLMADRFVYGDAERLSPEAPVPVVRITRRETMPGGAANVAVNVAMLGGGFSLFGVLGDDGAGTDVLDYLADLGGNVSGIVRDNSRPTTVKTRIVARSQHLLRYDYEQDGPLGAETKSQLSQRLDEAIADLDVVVASDYAKGVFSGDAAAELTAACDNAKVPLLVDPKPVNATNFRGAFLIKPNLGEALRLAGWEHKPQADEMPALCQAVGDVTGVQNVVITAGGKGMYVLAGGEFAHLPGMPREVFDVAGAGDTTMAAIALGVAAKLDVFSAARLGNLAGSIAVGKLGTAAATQAELLAELEGHGG